MILVIMAAGLGSRFGGLKQIEPVDEFGNFLIDYSVYDAVKAGFDKVVFVIRKENFELFKNSIGKRIASKVKVDYVFQENEEALKNYPRFLNRQKPLGTGFAILLLKDKIKENFAVINADDFYGRESFFKLAEFLKTNNYGNMFSLISYDIKNTLSPSGEVKRGVCEIENGFLKSITECRVEQKEETLTCETLLGGETFLIKDDTKVSMNMFGFTPKIFEFLSHDFKDFLNSLNTDPMSSEFFLPNVVTSAISNSLCKTKAINTSSSWLGLTYKQDLEFVKFEISKLNSLGLYNGINK